MSAPGHVRVGAIADVHFGVDSAGTLLPHMEHLHEHADMLLVAGDLTRRGTVAEAEVLARELQQLSVPTFAVLGNHDYHADQEKEIAQVLRDHGVTALECERSELTVNGVTVAIVGMKGFGGGFAGACGADFGEPVMKEFTRHTKEYAAQLENLLYDSSADVKIALLHYSPIEATLKGERLEIYPFLGSYLLGEAIDRGGADLVLHGHAHRGNEKGITACGTHVRNVAEPVIGRAYAVYGLTPGARARQSDSEQSASGVAALTGG